MVFIGLFSAICRNDYLLFSW